jgi:hypothetical protein
MLQIERNGSSLGACYEYDTREFLLVPKQSTIYHAHNKVGKKKILLKQLLDSVGSATP